MGAMSLADILMTPLARIPVAGGDVLHAMKQSDAGFNGFGEAYFSMVESGSVKAWKRHRRMTMNFVVPVGKVRFVFCLPDDDSFCVKEIGMDNYMRITVPAGIWFGFKGIADSESLVLNIANIAHDPDEVDRCDLSVIKYDWR